MTSGRSSLPNQTLRAADTARRCGVVYLVLLLAVCLLSICALLPVPVRAQAPHPLKQDETCLACHGQASAALPHEDFETVVRAVEAAELWGTVAVYDPQPFAYDFIQLIAACCGGIAKSVGASELSRSAACTLLRRLRQAAPPNRVPELERVVKSICEERQAL